MMLKLAVLLGCAVALCSGCCTPDQWEGGMGAVVGYSRFLTKGLIREYLSISYDYKNKRSASELYYKNGKVKAKIQMLVRYCDESVDCSKGRLYILNVDSGKCYVKSLKKDFRKACVPKEARMSGEASLGLKGGLNITSYELDGDDFMATVSVSKIGKDLCVPIGEIIAKKGRYTTLRDAGFVNITPGIKDPSVFDVPKQCEGVEEKENVKLADELLGGYSFFTF